METVVLASASPRRKELMESIGVPCVVIPADIDEDSIRAATPLATANLLAAAKARAVADRHPERPERLYLGLDTLIDLNGRILEKPRDRSDARSMLEALSGTRHRVITAVCLMDRNASTRYEKSHESLVCFKDLSEQEITRYLDTGEWEGVAGAYRIQGIAGCFIEHIEGSWSGIVGLPLHIIYGMLVESGYRFGTPAH